MRLMHTSDLHLGISVMGENFIEMQGQMVKELCRIAEERAVDGVIVAGDVFDRAVSSREAVELYNTLATELCIRRRKKLLVAAGNHDGAERLASCSRLLEQAGLYVRGRLALPIEPVELGNADIYILPYFNQEEARLQTGAPELKSAEEAMEAVLATIQPRAGRQSILVAHCFVRGCATSESDRSAVVGGSAMVGAGLFQGFDYVALGHLHKPQRAGGNIRYSGTPMQYSFAEEGQQKQVILLDTETMEQEEVPLEVGRPFRTVRGTYDEILAAAGDEDAFVRVVLTDREVPPGMRDRLKEKYSHLMQLVSVFQPEGAERELTVADVQQLRPTEILDGFLEEYAGRAASAEEKEWFESAYTEALRGVEP